MPRALIALGLLLGAARALAGCAPEPIDDVAWACQRTSECGPGARCSDGLCRRVPAGASPDLCELALPSARVAADLHRDGAGASLVITLDGGAPRSFRLPAGVKAVSLPACCRNACCGAPP